MTIEDNRVGGAALDATERGQVQVALADKQHVLAAMQQTTQLGFWFVDHRGITTDLNPAMCRKAQTNATAAGTSMDCRSGSMEDVPLPDASVDVALSNGVINLSFRKRRVIEELFRVLRPGGRLSITDIVSAKQLSQSIVNDPKLWAS